MRPSRRWGTRRGENLSRGEQNAGILRSAQNDKQNAAAIRVRIKNGPAGRARYARGGRSRAFLSASRAFTRLFSALPLVGRRRRAVDPPFARKTRMGTHPIPHAEFGGERFGRNGRGQVCRGPSTTSGTNERQTALRMTTSLFGPGVIGDTRSRKQGRFVSYEKRPKDSLKPPASWHKFCFPTNGRATRSHKKA